MQNYVQQEKLSYRFGSQLWHLLLLNFLFLLTSIPVVTIGASKVALFAATTAMVEQKGGSIAMIYFKAFKKNFWQSTRLWGLSALSIWIVYLNWVYITQIQKHFTFMIGLFALCFVWVVVWQQGFFYLSRYNTSTHSLIKNCIKLSFKHPISNLVLFCLTFLPMIVVSLSPYLVVFNLYIHIFLGFSFSAFLRTFILLNFLRKHEKGDMVKE